MTAILVECGFMTNKADLKLLRSNVYRKTCAEAIVKGLREQFGLNLKASATPVPSQTAAQYKVVAGPFQEKATADKLLTKLKEEGFPVSIVSER